MMMVMIALVALTLLPICAASFQLTGGARLVDHRRRHESPNRRRTASQNSMILAAHNLNVVSDKYSDVPLFQEVILSFPSYQNLINLQYGEHVTSSVFRVGSEEFCVKLYPRGGGHSAKSKIAPRDETTAIDDGNGLGVLSPLLTQLAGRGSSSDEQQHRVGVYLQYLPKHEDDFVDATFGLRLQGNQQQGPKFDVEWRAGMRFVSKSKSNLKEGCANDFGAHLLETKLLQSFLGAAVDNMDDNQQTQLRADVTIHASTTSGSSPSTERKSFTMSAGNMLPFFDIRGPKEHDRQHEHDPELVRVGKIVVPLLERLDQRPRMFQLGAYPGVEYRILRILDSDGKDVFTSRPGAEYDLKPVYPLVRQLERPWPVRVNEREIPKLFTPTMYNILAAVGSVSLAVTGLATAWIASLAVSIFFIPSRSMEPTLRVGDALLVDKVTPRIQNTHQVGNVVLFLPPSQLRDIVASKGGTMTDRDLFVKRVAAGPGDRVRVEPSGSVKVNGKSLDGQRDLCGAEPLHLIEQYIHPTAKSGEDLIIEKDEVFVLGDCASVSIDSRVWGPLKTSEIVGRPVYRVWPPQRFGPIPPLLTTSDMETSD